MKLHIINGSPSSRKTLAVARHLGLDLELAWLDIFEADHKTPEFLALNPNGMVPVLQDGAFTLWESNAINLYLCKQAEKQSLLPEDHQGMADVMRWLSWELAHFNKAFGVIALEAVAKPNFGRGETNTAVVDYMLEDLTRFAAILDAHLEGRNFLVGNDWTIADYAVAHVEFFFDPIPFDWAKYPNVVRYYEQFRNNEFWQSTMPKSPAEIGRIPS